MDLKVKVKNLPSSPGVYLMQDSLGGIIYVGKAKNLKRRVQSYFQNSKSHPPKVEKLVKHLRDFEYILTDTEFDAFLLECKLIKEIKPIYNKKMKNPLSYTYIEIQMNKEYPKIALTNSPLENDNTLSFGPYTSKSTVERSLQGIRESNKIMCSNPSIKNSSCLNYSLGLCIGMCLGGSSVEQYNKIINRIIALLQGTDLSILKELEQKMLVASEKFDFENAAKYRDYLNAINFLLNKEKVIEFTEANKNIVILEPLKDSTIKLFLIKGNQVLFSEKFLLGSTDIKQLSTIIKANILTIFNSVTLNSLIELKSDVLDEAQIIYSYLKGSNCSFIIISERWLDSEDNADLDEAIKKLLGCLLSNLTNIKSLSH